ncbi:glycoside hydrolase domain-containing protein [uncultured Sunxiuqinia sp.]|nr:glycoside hydrolase domain-containing protein [uncultured Sunxiuqinia sp.]
MKNKYIQWATLNGEELDTLWITHQDIESGGKLVLKMGPKANRNWGI